MGQTPEGLTQRFAFVYARPNASGRMAVYGEVPLLGLLGLMPTGIMTGDEFQGLQIALYTGAEDSGAVLFATTQTLPLPEPHRAKQIPVGGGTWSLVVSASSPLTSPLERSAPRTVLSFGLIVAVILAATVEAVSRRRRRAAQAREERFGLLVQQSSDVVTVIDSATVLSYQSPSAARILGYAPDELAGSALADLIHPKDLETFTAALDGALQDPGGTLFFAVRLRHRDGHWLRLEATGRNLLHEPVIGGLVLNWLDVSEREEAREARDRLASVVEATPDVVLTTDDEGRVVFLNAAGRNLFGVGPNDDLNRRSLRSFFSEHTAAAILGPALDAAHRHRSWAGEMTIAPLGGEVPVLAVLVEHQDERRTRTFISVIARDIRDRKELEHQLAHQAFHDHLTGLPNRALFNDRLGQAIERAKRSLDTAAVLLIDLDNFKTVNDSLGHPAGDALLQQAAKRIRACLRSSDTLARLGGDEFAVVLDGAAEDVQRAIAERILNAFRLPFQLARQEVITTASIGVAAIGLLDAQCSEEALQAADMALYAAKSKGKATWALFEPSMMAAASERLELQVDLHRAVERDELVLHYQPIVATSGREVVGLEALVRWNHPRLGLLPPDRFITLAEESGLIVEIGRWVLQRACRQMVDWGREHADLGHLHLSVNVSGRQFDDPNFRADVAAALADSGFQPERLVLEITESVLVQHALAAELLRELKTLGLRVAIDDFGTGYSSFSSLQHLPVDILKIDKSFIDEIGAGNEPTLVSAILRLGSSMGLEVVAEGVEEEQQAESLAALHCPLAQGFLFARPIAEPPDRLIDVLTRLRSGTAEATPQASAC
jgi:diguanylate cyclase (GGDEF)-like protein/PAS domain S-box-containing protein